MPLVVALLLALLAAAAPAAAHIERQSYWPDPAPDTAVSPAAGGAVPVPRTLRSGLRDRATKVVCQADSVARTRRSARRPHRLRPSAPARRLNRRAARRHVELVRRFKERCRFHSIQAAVNGAGNNGRVVILPGHYLERASQRQPTNDPRCADLREPSEDGPGGATYAYQVTCPNDQSLIFVLGRALTDVTPPSPPHEDRRVIPDAGPCVRCNVQIEGAGVAPDDVVIDAATDPALPLRRQAEKAKDVVIKADRADGIVIRNLTTTHARETGIYVHETDGYLIDDVKSLYNRLYGTLTFTSDNGLTSDCELAGSGDSGAYPGGAPDSAPRLNQTITRCDLHRNAAGFSATMGNNIHLLGNEVYDNATGVFFSSIFPGGHPGYPQDGALIERNNIYSNNYDAYGPDSELTAVVPQPIGVGLFIAGGNANTVRDNRIWDNHRHGMMLVSLPDALIGQTSPGPFFSTSHHNQVFGNVVGVDPQGERAPNGVDFWFDDAPTEGNCWHDNGIVSSRPAVLPSACDQTNVGLTYAVAVAELLPCFNQATTGDFEGTACAWYTPPAQPQARRASFPDAEVQPIGRGSTPEQLMRADCGDWLAASRADRRAVVDRLAAIIAGPRGEGSTLAPPLGRALLHAHCRLGYARGFLLFDLYARAAAF